VHRSTLTNARLVRALAAVAVFALAAPALGYVNGGDYHSTIKTYEKKLTAAGYRTAWGSYWSTSRGGDAKRVAGSMKDDAVNQLVGKALKALPRQEAARISAADKEEVARKLKAALSSAAADGKESVKKGKAGSLHFEVGVHEYEYYWETNYKGERRKKHNHQTGLIPFVALKIRGEKKSD
jgi:hypothetical protein